VVDSYDALVDLLEAIGHILKRLDVYTEISPTPAMDELVVKIMAELLSTLDWLQESSSRDDRVSPF